ncbi:MAG: hypothetical protein RLY43_1711 [Bacteroidota bacterium]|jgi:UPF0755 protein
MPGKISATIQNTLKWLVPMLLIFAVFYAFSEQKKEQLVVLHDEKSEKEIVEELKERGYISNSISYFITKIALKFGADIESGAFLLHENMGPFSLLAALASPEYKYVAVVEGMRKEEMAEVFASKLNWDEKEKEEFAAPINICILSGGEGYLFPGKYLVHKDYEPEDVKKLMEEKLNEVVEDLGKEEDAKILNTNQILIIASLIQREAAGKSDMKLISGVIWNRIFNGMPLQIDATLQYAKGNEENGWWPPVKAEDKYIESPYNTYKIEGLPPGPIANPGLAAIDAALNPLDTKCLFYLHDKNRVIHCASTYEAHKKNVRYYLK